MICLFLFFGVWGSSLLPLHPGTEIRLHPSWSFDLALQREASLTAFWEVEGILLIADEAGGVTALDGATGDVLWILKMGQPVTMAPAIGAGLLSVVAGEKVVVVGLRDGLRACDRLTGEVFSGSPMTEGVNLFIPSLNGDRLVVQDLKSGLPQWEMHLSSMPIGPVLDAGGRILLLTTSNGDLRGLPMQAHPPKGNLWLLKTNGIVGRPVVEGGVAYLATRQPAVLAVEASSGVVLWKHPLEIQATSRVVVKDGAICVSHRSGMDLLDARDGAQLWRQGREGEVALGVANGYVVVRDAEGKSGLRSLANGDFFSLPTKGLVYPVGDSLIELAGAEGDGSFTSVKAWHLAP